MISKKGAMMVACRRAGDDTKRDTTARSVISHLRPKCPCKSSFKCRIVCPCRPTRLIRCASVKHCGTGERNFRPSSYLNHSNFSKGPKARRTFERLFNPALPGFGLSSNPYNLKTASEGSTFYENASIIWILPSLSFRRP